MHASSGCVYRLAAIGAVCKGITWRFPQTAFAKLSSAKPREEVDTVYKRNWPLGIRSPFRGPPSTPLAFIAGEEPQL
ncbi:hypothetical protein ALC62_00300 [Cyphomyrmex costatus]|uniref:Uncharacterized protein n=1 Tax=Cyphomyrmex costatus TaxID=456900 RepID=A0A195D857_9HYME|nr:hypothetical protein ALC62_00300 [Cyphomyrmex costatus]